MADAKSAAHARWPEIKREFGQIVETYNAQHETLGIRLTLAEESSLPGRLQPMILTIHGDHRTLAAMFTIGDTNMMGYRLTETMLGGHQSAIPDGLPKQGGVTNIGDLIKKLVVGVMERNRH